MNEELAYLEALHTFKESIIHVDNLAKKGMELSRIKKRLQTLASVYCSLIDLESINSGESIQSTGKNLNKDLQGNMWMSCPECGKRLIRVDKCTEFCNLPMFCKRCKKEFMLNLR